MSMAALECMAAGKPIVAWDSPVYRQMLTERVSARLVPEGDPDALGATLAALVTSDAESARLGAAAAAAAQKYDWRVVGERFLAEVNAAIEGLA
jgi:glycosyltransferase involved in cell wall biosynthesis